MNNRTWYMLIEQKQNTTFLKNLNSKISYFLTLPYNPYPAPLFSMNWREFLS